MDLYSTKEINNMINYNIFDEKLAFSFVDNPSINYIKDIDFITKEYKEDSVKIMLNHR